MFELMKASKISGNTAFCVNDRLIYNAVKYNSLRDIWRGGGGGGAGRPVLKIWSVIMNSLSTFLQP